MKRSDITAKAVADVLPPDQARAFPELVRAVQQRTNDETLEIRDEAGEVFGFLMLPAFHDSPDDPPTDPEFLKELERRLQSPEPAIKIDEEGIDLEDLIFGDDEQE